MTDVKLLVCVGYGFANEHINGIISQALNGDHSRKMLVVAPAEKPDEKRQHICNVLKVSASDNVILLNSNAKDFFESKLNVKELASVFPNEEAPFEEIMT